MATKNAALRNKIAADFGALWNEATLAIRDSGNDDLVVFTLHTTAFEADTEGKIVAHASSLTTENAIKAGTAHNAILTSSGAGTYVLSGLTVGTTAANVIISNTSIELSQPISLNKLDWTEPAGIA